ncbi:quinon protein alcohol dehydrogenase-like superfamily [Chiua virens]|nr:quinon protein alcohol dehydrogenase-like superfamily [Chiua virens]
MLQEAGLLPGWNRHSAGTVVIYRWTDAGGWQFTRNSSVGSSNTEIVHQSFRVSSQQCLGYLTLLRPNPADNLYREIWTRQLSSGLEITCIAACNVTCRIAVGTLDNIVQILLFTNSQLQSVFAGRLDNTMPKSVAFTEDGGIYVFGPGHVVQLSEGGKVVSEHRCQSAIGSAAVHLKKRLFIIDNTMDGLTLYRLDSGQTIRTFKTDPPSVPVPKQVAFGEEGKVVIGGSDNSCVYVFDRRTGELVETLHHPGTALVPTISVCDVDGECIITCATLNVARKKATVDVWSCGYSTRKSSASVPWRSIWAYFSTIFVFLSLLIILTHILHNGASHAWISDWATAMSINMSCLFHSDKGKFWKGNSESESETLHRLAQQIVEIIQADGLGAGPSGTMSMQNELDSGKTDSPAVIYL